MDPIILRPKDAFAALGIGVTKGYELIAIGELQAIKIGRVTGVTVQSIRGFVARRLAERG